MRNGQHRVDTFSSGEKGEVRGRKIMRHRFGEAPRRVLVLLALIAVATASIPLSRLQPSAAYADQGRKITFANGNSATLHPDGSVTGKARLTGGWMDEDRMGHHDKMVMPDGAKLPAGCYEKYIQQSNHAEYGVPADGTYPFTATPQKKGGYFVLMHSQDSKYIVGYAGVWPGKVQQSYAENWEPDISLKVTFRKGSSETSFTAGNDAYRVEGAEYRIVRKRDDREIARITTGQNGTASCKLEPNTEYYAVETKAPQGFQKNPKPIAFTTEISDMTVALTDKPVNVAVRIRKHDSATGGAAQPGVTLKGAVYKLVDARGNAQEATTDEDGSAVFKKPVPIGKLTITEVKPPQGYKPDKRVHTFETKHADKATDGTITLELTEAFAEDIVAFDLEIAKHKQDPNDEEGGPNTPAEGVKFDVISNSTGKTVVSLTTDKDGFAKTPADAWYGVGTRPEGVHGSIPYDAKGYTVREDPSTVPDGYEQMPDFIIDPSEMSDGVTLRYIVENVAAASRLQIVKVDSQSGQPVALPGFTFQLLDKDKNPISQDVWYPNHIELDTFTTDETGRVTLPGQLVPGTYYIREIEAVKPYLLNGELLEVEIGGEKDELAVVTFANDRAVGSATIRKTDAETGEVLEGAVYDVRAVEEIVGADGVVQASAGERVTQVTTGKDGVGTASNLPLGTGAARFEFVEVKAPNGYVLDPTPHPFELSYRDQETAVVTAEVEASDAPSKLIVEKTDKESGKPLAGVTFELTRASEPEGLESPEDKGRHGEPAPHGRVTTDKHGRATWSHLTAGSYELREIEAPSGYVVDCTARTIVVSDNGSLSGEGVEEGVVRIVNDTTKVEISKRDSETEELVEGAHLEIHDEHGSVVERWVSADEPHLVTTLNPGTYTLVEERTPSTHDTAEPVPFSVEESTERIEVVMYDKPLHIDAQIDKRQEAIDSKRTGNDTGGPGFSYEVAARNTSGTWVDEFTVTDGLLCVTDGMAKLVGITTPRAKGDYDGLMNVWYQTNMSEREGGAPQGPNATLEDGHENPWLNQENRSDAIGEDGRGCPYEGWLCWREDVPTNEAIELDVSDLELREGEHVVAVRFEYGCVNDSFTMRDGLWKRPDIKSPDDPFAMGESGNEKLSPALFHLRTTKGYKEGETMRNSAFVDAFRNGGGEGLEAHDRDSVEQSPHRTIVPRIPTLDQTGTDPMVVARVFALATIITGGLLVVRSGFRSLTSGITKAGARKTRGGRTQRDS